MYVLPSLPKIFMFRIHSFLLRDLQITRWLVLFLFCGGVMKSNSQIHIVENTRLVLPSVDNYRTVIDKKGITWICSENGLIRYNFERSKRFQIADGLPTNDIWQLYNDHFDRMWLFHKEKGIYYIQNDSVHLVKGSEHLRETFVVADLNDTIFFKTFGYFNQNNIGDTYYCTKNGKFGKSNLDREKPCRFAGRKFSRRVLIAGNRVYSDGHGTHYADYRSFSYGNITSNDSLYILFVNNPKSDDILFLSRELNRVQSMSELIGVPFQRTIFFRNSIECIVEVNNTIRFYDNIALNHRDLGIERILSPFYAAYGMDFDFTKDDEGNIWITVHRGGVHFIPTSYSKINPLQHYELKGSKTMERNFVYLGSINDRLYVFSRNSIIQEIHLKTGKKKVLGSSRDLKDVKINGNYIAWSNNDGISIHNAVTGITKKMTTGQRVVSFDFADKTTLYANTGHTYNLKNGKITPQALLKGEIDQMVITDEALFSYKNNELIVRKRKGLDLVYSAKHKNIINAERLSQRYVGFFIENNGVIVFDNFGTKIAHLFKGNSIQKAFLFENLFFAVTDQDILHVSANSNGDFSRKIHRYHTFLGRINLSIQSATIHNGSLILGLNNGIYSYQLSDILTKKSYPPKLYLSGISVNNLPNENQKTTFSHSDKDFIFSFNSYSYGTFGDVLLNYKLTGLDDKWYSSKSNTINYKSLPPGDYILSVFASANGDRSELINYSFSIPIPFWKSVPFITLCFVLFMIALIKVFYIAINYRSRFYERKNLLLELEFRALKAQLNPHFIFNSLNSLQTVMHRKSEMEANEYIVSFSKLMRTLLDNSRVLSISLADELEFLKNFVFLSAQKINDPISFHVEMENVSDPTTIHVRNMILQPFIENAVLHGLANKDGEKWIRLTISQLGQMLTITITDNGVGRKAAYKYNQRIVDRHASVSTSILKEKSRLLKEMNLEELNFVTNDLYANGSPIGTEVIVRMRVFNPST